MTVITNGQVDPALLVQVGTERLRAGTASRWAQVCAEVARRYGWTPTIYPDGGYRDIIEQRTIFLARYTRQAAGSGPYGDVRWWAGVRYVRTSPAGPAAVPGTSNHGLGKAIDVADVGTVGDFSSPRRAQFAAVAIPAGFSDAEGRAAGEPWHWVDTFDPDAIAVSGVVVSTPGVTTPTLPTPPAPIAPVEDDMAHLLKHPNGTIALVGPGPQFTVLHDMDEVGAVQATGQATGTLIDPGASTLIWDKAVAVAQRAGAYHA